MRYFLVRRSVGPSVRRGDRVEKLRKRAFPPPPTRPRLVLAVYPALLFMTCIICFHNFEKNITISHQLFACPTMSQGLNQ